MDDKDKKILNSSSSMVVMPASKQTQGYLISSNQILPGTIKPLMLAATPVIANGDTYYSNGTTFVRLPIGATGTHLVVSSGVPAWSTNNGYSGTITTAKLTGGGANGTITVVDGVITAVVAAT